MKSKLDLMVTASELDINLKDYVEAIVMSTSKTKRNGFGSKIVLLIGKTQHIHYGVKVISFSKNKVTGTCTLAVAETIDLINRIEYKIEKCLIGQKAMSKVIRQ